MAAGTNRKGHNEPTLAEKRVKAVELRKAGHGYRVIAEKVGYCDASAARKAVLAALKTIVREPTEEMVKLEVERLDAMLVALWPYATREKPNLKTQDRVLKIMERRAKLLGLDAPTKLIPIPPDLSAKPPIGPDGQEAAI